MSYPIYSVAKGILKMKIRTGSMANLDLSKGIYWNAVYNPFTGCTWVSEACDNCYAKRLHDMRHKAYLAGKQMPDQYALPFETIQRHQGRISDPLHWRKHRVAFVCNGSDLFHKDVDPSRRREMFRVMKQCSQHTFLVLTKRAESMASCLKGKIVLPNVWLGVTAENQDRADERIPHLLKLASEGWSTWLSCEPLLGAIKFKDIPVTLTLEGERYDHNALTGGGVLRDTSPYAGFYDDGPQIGGIIAGGESGTGERPSHPDWFRSLRDQCKDAGVPFMMKQWGEFAPRADHPDADDRKDVIVAKSGRQATGGDFLNNDPDHAKAFDGCACLTRIGKKAAGRELDGQLHNAMPWGGD